jgi:XTP/dITP diphosphohydrolase
MQVLLATRNTAKGREMARLLGQLPDGVSVQTLASYPSCPEADEIGATFSENALIKARSAAAHCGSLAIADDSGLAVAWLGGEPGVLSARYVGRHGDDQANNRLLLGKMAGVPVHLRGARFVTAVAMVEPGGLESAVEGECHGVVAFRPRGSGGFGYDAIFLRPELGLTFAELPPADKDALSHRGRAFAKLTPLLREVLRQSAGRGNRQDPN